MTHIILLDDGKIWAFEPPEKPVEQELIGASGHMIMQQNHDAQEAYNRAYSLALEQKIEAENPKVAIDWANGYLNLYTEATRWEGTFEIIKQFRPVGTAAWHDLTGVTVHDNSGFEFRKLVRLIAPVKEEPEYAHLTEKDKAFIELMKVPDSAFQSKPVPSEQEKHYTERDLEIAYCIGLLNRMISMDELSEELKTSRDKIDRLKEAIKRGDFTPVNNNRP